MRRFLELAAAATLVVAFAGGAQAQSQSSAPAGGSSTTTTPGKVVGEDLVPPGAAGGPGVQGQNIFDVKPEVKRDASSEPADGLQFLGVRRRGPGKPLRVDADRVRERPQIASGPVSGRMEGLRRLSAFEQNEFREMWKKASLDRGASRRGTAEVPGDFEAGGPRRRREQLLDALRQ